MKCADGKSELPKDWPYKRCRYHLNLAAARAKRQYHKLRDRELCTCRRKAMPGKSKCAKHMVEMADRRMTLYYKRVAQRRCVQCDTEMAQSDFRVRCDNCPTVKTEFWKAHLTTRGA